jgi:predicted transcriptional regulator of viral defense system
MPLADTYRRRLHDGALDRYGYVTTRSAAEVGVPSVELRKLTTRGGLRNVAYGLYRFDDIPPTDRDQFMEAVLRVGPDAYLTHDAVLDLHGIGLVNPRRVRVATPHRTRAHHPPHIEVIHRTIDSNDLTVYEGIPSTTVARALLDCRGLVMAERLIEAAQAAAQRGLLRRTEAERILAQLAEVV